MKKLFLIMAMIFANVAGTGKIAMGYSLELGIRQQAGDVSGLSISANSMTGIHGGVVQSRTGILYTQRPSESEFA